MINSSAETLLITLSSDAEFQLDGNVFENDRLNRIMIQGRGPSFGQEHVEINANAFNGNTGPFPEIEIVNVHTVILHSNAFYCEYQIPMHFTPSTRYILRRLLLYLAETVKSPKLN